MHIYIYFINFYHRKRKNTAYNIIMQLINMFHVKISFYCMHKHFTKAEVYKSSMMLMLLVNVLLLKYILKFTLH